MTPNPEIQTVRAAITTNAVANTQTTTAMIAAPGAGLRIRIMSYSIGSKPNNTGAIRALIQNGGGSNFDVLGVPTGRGAGVTPNLGPGIPFPANDSVNAVHDSDVASQPFNLIIHYVIEDV